MEYRENDYPIFLNQEKDSKRKSSRKCSTNGLVHLGVQQVIPED
jgi:hypothetical protein